VPRDTVEQMIRERYQRALRAIARAPFQPAAAEALAQIAETATTRKA
jgi:hypothetical protein